MVLITEEQGKGSKVQENGVAGGVGITKIEYKTTKVDMDIPAMVVTKAESREANDEEIEVDYTRNYWEDEDDIYQEFEDLDFESLSDHSDTQSIASDNSFYPYDSSLTSQISHFSHLSYSLCTDSPEPISFFKACCSNNAIIVKVMIRQGVTEEEVKETDRNRRVGICVQYLLERRP